MAVSGFKEHGFRLINNNVISRGIIIFRTDLRRRRGSEGGLLFLLSPLGEIIKDSSLLLSLDPVYYLN